VLRFWKLVELKYRDMKAAAIVLTADKPHYNALPRL
jgi:hypothetical protein